MLHWGVNSISDEAHKRGSSSCSFVPVHEAPWLPFCYTSITFKSTHCTRNTEQLEFYRSDLPWLCFGVVSCSLFAANLYPLSFAVRRRKEMLLSVPGSTLQVLKYVPGCSIRHCTLQIVLMGI